MLNSLNDTHPHGPVAADVAVIGAGLAGIADGAKDNGSFLKQPVRPW